MFTAARIAAYRPAGKKHSKVSSCAGSKEDQKAPTVTSAQGSACLALQALYLDRRSTAS